MSIKSIAVFCGSSDGASPSYIESAVEAGRIIASENLGLVFGGGDVGLMGAVSRTAVENRAAVTGVIPEKIVDMVKTTDGIKLITVKNMHERKQIMYDLSDAFMILPGGIGTLEEAFEVCTWNQLGYMSKPVCFLNTEGFYSKLRDFLSDTVREKFFKAEHYKQILFEDTPEKAVNSLMNFKPVYIKKL